MQRMMMSMEQQMVYNLLMCDPKDERIPSMPMSQEALEVGAKLNELFKNKTFTKMYMDQDSVARVE